MTTLRKASERGHVNWGWLDTYHTFSFSDYFDQDWVHFGTLRVMNEDTIAAGTGFGMHPHRDMEIITYVLSGGVQHEDSMGNAGVIKAGEVQRMSAGTGIFHSETNPFAEPLYLYQIWIFPSEKNRTPSYEQKIFSDEAKKNRLLLIASPDGADGSVTIGQNAKLFASLIDNGTTLHYSRADTNGGLWLQVVSGTITASGQKLGKGDGLAITEESSLDITATADAHVLLFDLN